MYSNFQSGIITVPYLQKPSTEWSLVSLIFRKIPSTVPYHLSLKKTACNVNITEKLKVVF